VDSDKATRYILQMVKLLDRLYLLTFQRKSLQWVELKMLKISIFFVSVIVVGFFVADKHKFKI